MLALLCCHKREAFMDIIKLYIIFSLCAVMWSDITRFRIPNWLVGGMLLAYGIACYLVPMPWISGLQVMGIVFVGGYILFVLNLMGGGDVKLLAACALWVGMAQVADYLALVALIGGAFAVLVWVARKVLALVLADKLLPRILKNGEPIAYGVPISLAFLWLMYAGRLHAL